MTARQANFSRFEDCTKEDMEIVWENLQVFAEALPSRVLEHLKLLGGDFGGFAVDRLEHSLQTATRAHRDGRDEEYVVCCLLHDIGDTLNCYDHSAIGAAIVKPFVSEANHWMVENHPDFQGYYFYHHVGGDRNARDRFKDHPHYAQTEEFIRKYDMPAFDKDYDSMTLEEFEPMVARVLSK